MRYTWVCKTDDYIFATGDKLTTDEQIFSDKPVTDRLLCNAALHSSVHLMYVTQKMRSKRFAIGPHSTV